MACVSIPKETLQRFEKLAEAYGVTTDFVVHEALTTWYKYEGREMLRNKRTPPTNPRRKTKSTSKVSAKNAAQTGPFLLQRVC